MDSGKRHAHLGGDSPLFQAGWPSARTHGSRETGVHQKTVNRLVKFLDQFKQMNFVNDQEMEQQLEAVRKELFTRSAEEYRDSTKARTHG